MTAEEKGSRFPFPVDGVLVVDKPAGPTSHDIVARARQAIGTRAIGHTGTLDPAATGVLALVVGRATRLAAYLGGDKAYEAHIRFGRVTDTYDATGDLVSESHRRPSREQLIDALARFRGTFAQAPPPFSAKKIAGVPAHALARRARPVQPAPVMVMVKTLELDAFDGEVARLSLVVSAGFYVRSLAHDLGGALGMGATLDALRRTRAGTFTLGEAVEAARLTPDARTILANRVISIDAVLPDVPALALSDAEVAGVRHGQDVEGASAPLVRLVDGGGHLIALGLPGKRRGFLHPAVVLG